MKTYKFTVLIEKDESGFYIASVPALKSCYTQARTLDELFERIEEAIRLSLEVEGAPDDYQLSFVGVHQLEIVT